MKLLYSYFRTEFWKRISKNWSISNIKTLKNRRTKMWDVLPCTTTHKRPRHVNTGVIIKNKILQKINWVSGKMQTLTLYMASGQLTGHENRTLQFTETVFEVESCPCFPLFQRVYFLVHSLMSKFNFRVSFFLLLKICIQCQEIYTIKSCLKIN